MKTEGKVKPGHSAGAEGHLPHGLVDLFGEFEEFRTGICSLTLCQPRMESQ